MNRNDNLIEPLIESVCRQDVTECASKGTIIIVQGPTSSGKTLYLENYLKRYGAGRGAYLTSEAVVDMLIYIIKKNPYQSESWIQKTFVEKLQAGADCIAIDDLDISLAGKKQTQIAVAHAIAALASQGVDVIVAGIHLEARVSEFWTVLHSDCSQKISCVTLEK